MRELNEDISGADPTDFHLFTCLRVACKHYEILSADTPSEYYRHVQHSHSQETDEYHQHLRQLEQEDLLLLHGPLGLLVPHVLSLNDGLKSSDCEISRFKFRDSSHISD